MAKTWYRKTSDGTFFRNCPLIMKEMDKCPLWRILQLQSEWDKCFREGIIKTDKIGRFDNWIEYDDFSEATHEWLRGFMGERFAERWTSNFETT